MLDVSFSVKLDDLDAKRGALLPVGSDQQQERDEVNYLNTGAGCA